MVVVICVVGQMNYLNKALDTFNTAMVSSVYYIFFTICTITASMIMYKDWENQTATSISWQLLGFVMIVVGVYSLNATQGLKDTQSAAPRGCAARSRARAAAARRRRRPRPPPPRSRARQARAARRLPTGGAAAPPHGKRVELERVVLLAGGEDGGSESEGEARARWRADARVAAARGRPQPQPAAAVDRAV